MAADKPFIKRPEKIDQDRAKDIIQKFYEPSNSQVVPEKEKKEKKLTITPSSFLRFAPFIGKQVLKQEMMKSKGIKPEDVGEVDLEKEVFKTQEDEKTADFAKEIQRSIYSGGAKATQAVLSFITSGIDYTFDTDTNKALDKATKDFINIHGEPETFAGEIGSILTQFAAPGGVVFKVLGKIGQLKKVNQFNKLIDSKVGKIKNKYLKSTAAGATTVARYSGQGGLSLGIADALFSDPGRTTFFTEKVSEENKSGRDLAVARLINKLKFAQEGTLIGAGIPLAGAGLKIGFKYGLYPPLKGATSIGFKALDTAVVRPITYIASKDKYILPNLAKGAQLNLNFIGELGTRLMLPLASRGKVSPFIKLKEGLPEFKEWRLFTVNSADDLRVALKRIDNAIYKLRSVGPKTGEAYQISAQADQMIKAKARVIEKLLESLEKRAYMLAKGFQNQYNKASTSPASRDKYLDEVLEYLENKRTLNAVQKELQPTASLLQKELISIKKTFSDLLPEDNILQSILTKNIKGYLRKSFQTFTNPNYTVQESSQLFKSAQAFAKNIIRKNKDLKDRAKLEGGMDESAKLFVKNILRIGKTNGQDPIVLLNRIAKKIRMEKFVATGEELPKVVRQLLGQENNLKASVLTTTSQMYSQAVNRQMFDRLGTLLEKSGLLFKSKEAAQAYAKTDVVRQVGHIEGLGLLNSETTKLYGTTEMIDALTTLKGPLDFMLQSDLYKNLLQLKTLTQYGKTVLSPETQTRNFVSAAFFLLNRGLIGGRASVTESIKMIADDIFAAGKMGPEAEKRLLQNIEEGIKYGVLDENIVASELNAVIREIQRGSIKSMNGLTKLLENTDLTRTAGRLYAGGDNIWKWTAYNWYKSFLKDYAKGSKDKMIKWFKDIAGRNVDLKNIDGSVKSLDDLIKQASAYYVRNTMPTYSKVPDLIKALRRLPFGNFISFPAEMIRTSANTLMVSLREIASKDPILRQMGYRGLMGQYVTLEGAGAALKGIASVATGVSEDLMKIYQTNFGPEFQKNSNLIAVTPIEKGVFKVADLSAFLPYDTVTRPFTSIANHIKNKDRSYQTDTNFVLRLVGDASKELLGSFFSEPIFLEPVIDVIYRNGRTKEGSIIYSNTDDPDVIIRKIINHTIKVNEPGLITSGRKFMLAAENGFTKGGTTYDMKDLLIGLGTGVKPQKVDISRSLDFVVSDYSRIRSEVYKGEKFYSTEDVFNRGPEVLTKEFIDIQREAFTQQKEIYNKIKAAKEFGLSNREIKKLFTGRGLGSTAVNNLMRGKFIPVSYSESRFKKKIETIKKDQKRRGLDKEQILQKSFFYPKRELDKVIRQLKRDSLDKPFHYDIIKQKEGIGSLPMKQTAPVAQVQPTRPQTPPLPQQPQPQPVVASAPTAPLNNGLTQSEMALLSPSEQAIRLKQRGIA